MSVVQQKLSYTEKVLALHNLSVLCCIRHFANFLKNSLLSSSLVSPPPPLPYFQNNSASETIPPLSTFKITLSWELFPLHYKNPLLNLN
jgi:hypothetical protein